MDYYGELPMRNLNMVILLVLLIALASYAQERPRADFQVLNSNDFTHITSCKSPYNPQGGGFQESMLAESVREFFGVGVDVHMLQPAHSWVPWWQSKIYPMAEHLRWWESYFGVKPDKMSVHNYILAGGDPLKVFVEQCRKTNQQAFISFRMNDIHHLAKVVEKGNSKCPHAICRFYAEHPEYRLGEDKDHWISWFKWLQNWTIPEVRDYKFRLIEEICLNYDIDGFELDFMRAPGLFIQSQTTSEQRQKIITDFVRQVREALDKGARPGQYRWLSVRMPNHSDKFDAIGFDLPELHKAGVDMFVLSGSYYIQQQNGLREVVKMVPQAAVYNEIDYVTRNYIVRREWCSHGLLPLCHQRTTLDYGISDLQTRRGGSLRV